ncbi:hypothetical protein HDU67_007615 [Dinochytrium kinnereticum]|nr:hypothetical protein HDU67_007615 [Dinochytrium kinnereticum]
MSTYTQSVIITLREKNVAFEFISINLLAGEHKTPAFLAKQPFGEVPVLEDSETDVTLFESRAIVRYLAEKYRGQGTELLGGADVKERALVEVWQSVEATNFNPHASRIAVEIIFKPFFGRGQPDLALVEKARAALDATLDVYENRLSTCQYLAGNSFSLADLLHIPYGNILFAAGHGDALTSRPHVNAWWERITARESWVKTKP